MFIKHKCIGVSETNTPVSCAHSVTLYSYMVNQYGGGYLSEYGAGLGGVWRGSGDSGSRTWRIGLRRQVSVVVSSHFRCGEDYNMDFCSLWLVCIYWYSICMDTYEESGPWETLPCVGTAPIAVHYRLYMKPFIR